jgi:hypothetical protein
LLLLEYNELLNVISHNDTARAVAMIQQPGFNPNQLGKVEMFGDEFTWGALHCAAYYGNIKVIDALMEQGANIEMRDTWHRGTPLAWAAFAGETFLFDLYFMHSIYAASRSCGYGSTTGGQI